VGLNIALGLGGLVSFGHAAFFGIGGYVAGILASHAMSMQPLNFGLFTLPGSNQMPTIWLFAMLVGGLLAAAAGALSRRTSGVYFLMIPLAFSPLTFSYVISCPTYGVEVALSFLMRNRVPGFNSMVPLNVILNVYRVLVAALVLFARINDSRI